MSQTPFCAAAAAATACPVSASFGRAGSADAQGEAGMEDEAQMSESMVGHTTAASSSSAAAYSSSISAVASSLLTAAPIAAAAAAAAASSDAAAYAPTSLRVAGRRPAKLRATNLGDFFKPPAQRVETWNRRTQQARASGSAAERAKLKPTILADFFTPVAQCVDSWGPEKRAAQAMANDADTTAELSSVNKDSLQSIRLNELRVCFQLNNATLGLPSVPTELLQIVNEYCAPREGFRRLVAVAMSCTSKEWENIWFCSEAEFRETVRKQVLGDTTSAPSCAGEQQPGPHGTRGLKRRW